MRGVPSPPNEAARLLALERLRILDSDPEPCFDRLTRLVVRLFDVPIALVALVDAKREFWKSRIGIETREVAREHGFCAHALLKPAPLVVPDLARDPRFSANPLVVAAPRLRAYAGAPLVTAEGFVLGTLCAIDHRPRAFTAEQIALLTELSGLVVEELDQRLVRQRAEESAASAERSNEELRVLLESAPLAIWTLDASGNVLTWNRAAEQTFGWTAEEVVGRFLPTVGEEDRAAYAALARELEATRSARVVERRRHRKDGSSVDIRLAVSPLFDDDAVLRGFLSIAQDFTEEIRLREELRRAALVDPMTGLLNRRGFAENAARELARARREKAPLSVVLYDIDDFKRINDSHGHAAGDRVLAAVTRVLRESLRGVDIATRWGGDEMLVLLPGTDAPGARVVTERTRAAIAALDERGLPTVTISAGIAVWERGETVDATIARADRHLYEAKAAGRNRVV